jgi:hypothetical protein
MNRSISILALFTFLLIIGCINKKISRELKQVEEISGKNKDGKYLKVHLKNGELYVLHSWEVDRENKLISGHGNHLNSNRIIIDSRGSDRSNRKTFSSSAPKYQIPFPDVAIVESNDKGNNPGVPAMIVAGLVTLPISIICLVNPKSCFGSCPTYYINNEDGELIVGEGFSSSVSRSLEASDIDLINTTLPYGDSIKIRVKNEALETHLIRNLQLVVCPKQNENQVYLSSNLVDFFEVKAPIPPEKAHNQGTSILEEILKSDRKEWFNPSNSNHILTKEQVYLTFKNPKKASALLLEKRQSLLPTFLFYSTLAYLGKSTGYYWAAIEGQSPQLGKKITQYQDLLGGISVEWLDPDYNWVPIGELAEAGPIVSDTHIILFPEQDSEEVHFRLTLTQGMWRINTLQLVELVAQVTPVKFNPNRMISNGKENLSGLASLTDNEEYLVTFPGEDHQLWFPSLFSSGFSYFIESKGYYIEWMREEWHNEENRRMAKMAILRPKKYLEKLTPAYKAIEPEMEEIFWNSKYPSHAQ